MPALVVATLAVLLAIVAIAYGRNAATATPTPTAIPRTGAQTVGATYGSLAPQPGVGVIYAAAGLAQRAAAAPKVGHPAPEFNWLTTSGPMSLSQLRGHPVLLEFFAPWCPQCRHDVPLLNTFATDRSFKGLQVLAVSASPFGKDYESGSRNPIGMADLTWYHRTYGTVYPAVLDPAGRVFNLYGYGESYPTFFLVDARGIVRFTTSQTIGDNDLIARVQAAV